MPKERKVMPTLPRLLERTVNKVRSSSETFSTQVTWRADLTCGCDWLCLLRRLISGLRCSPNCWGRSSVSQASHRLHEAKSRVFCLNWLCSVQRGNCQRTWSVGLYFTNYIICFVMLYIQRQKHDWSFFFFTSRPGGFRSSEQTPSSPHCDEKVQLWSSSCSSLSRVCSQSNKRNSGTVSRDSCSVWWAENRTLSRESMRFLINEESAVSVNKHITRYRWTPASSPCHCHEKQTQSWESDCYQTCPVSSSCA